MHQVILHPIIFLNDLLILVIIKKKKTKFFRLGSQIKRETFYNLENIVEEDLDFLTKK